MLSLLIDNLEIQGDCLIMKLLFATLTLCLTLIACSSGSYRKNTHYDPKQNIELAKHVFLSYNKHNQNYTGAIILVYHRFGDRSGTTKNIDPKTFAKHLLFLRENNFKVRPLDLVIDDIKNGKAVDRTVAITIDDAYHNVIEVAHPLLTQFDYPYTLFVNTNNIGKAPFMTWETLKSLSSHKLVTIGNHSHQHINLINGLTKEQIKSDIIVASQTISNKLGIIPTLYSYPYGEYNQKTIDALKELNFKAALTQTPGVYSSEANPFIIPRFPMNDYFAQMVNEKTNGFEVRVYSMALPMDYVAPKHILKNNHIQHIEFTFNPKFQNKQNIHCFFNGQYFEKVGRKKSPNTYFITVNKEITQRRSFLTCNLMGPPFQENKPFRFHWNSLLFINPQVAETYEQ